MIKSNNGSIHAASSGSQSLVEVVQPTSTQGLPWSFQLAQLEISGPLLVFNCALEPIGVDLSKILGGQTKILGGKGGKK